MPKSAVAENLLSPPRIKPRTAALEVALYLFAAKLPLLKKK